MTTAVTPNSREEIEDAFSSLLRAHRKQASLIQTRAEAAERSREREIVDQASGYTVDSIVKGLAELQLDFSKQLEQLADRMLSESGKVAELQRAISVERRRLGDLQNLTIAAEALELLRQDHERKLADIDARMQGDLAELDEELAEQRGAAESAMTEHTSSVAATKAEQARERSEAEEAHAHERARTQVRTKDARDDERRTLERELAEQDAQQEHNWKLREEALDARGEELAALRTKVAGIDEAIATAESGARDKAISAVKRSAGHEAALAAHDATSSAEVYELKIKGLEHSSADHEKQIVELSTRLSAALEQAQKLATEALKTN